MAAFCIKNVVNFTPCTIVVVVSTFWGKNAQQLTLQWINSRQHCQLELNANHSDSVCKSF